MKNFLFVSVLFLLTSCVSMSHITSTSGLKEDYLKDIPKEAKVVIVQKNISADKLYDEVYTILLARNHRIAKDDKDRHYITTEGKDVGEDTYQRMIITITESGSTSNMRITGEWKASAGIAQVAGMTLSQDWAVAKWRIDRLGIDFAESVAVAYEIEGGRKSYE